MNISAKRHLNADKTRSTDINVWDLLRAPACGGLSADSGKYRQLCKLEEIIKPSREKANIKH